MYVIPLAPKGKNALIKDWPNQASNSRKQIEAWAAQWPDANVGCVGRCFVFLDDDRGDLKERIERETGKTFPATFTVNTSVKSTGMVGKHYYFEATVASIALGSRRLPGIMDFQADEGHQVVGPYSIHPSGSVYTPDDPKARFVPIPDWLCEWIEQSTPDPERLTADDDGPVAHEDWDCEAWLEHYGDVFTTSMDGDWHVTDICPLTWTGEGTGHKHSQSTKTGFRFDGNTPEFHCFSTDDDGEGTPHDEVSFGGVVKHLNKYHERYPGKIWEEDDENDDDWADIDSGSTTPEETTAQHESVPEQCHRDGCHCGLNHPYAASAAPSIESADNKVETEPEELILLGKRKDHPLYAAVTSMEKVIPKPIEWLWDQKIVRNHLTIFGGPPERGKSLATMDIVARVTTGRVWPDGSPNRLGPKNVLLLASEDGLDTVIWARLTAAGADLSRVKAIQGIVVGEDNRKNNKKRLLAFKQDVNVLRSLLKKIPDVALVVVDPITSYYGCDANKSKEVKPVMDSLKQLCEESNTAMIAVAHFSKRSDVDALQKVAGDVSVGGTARVAWTFSEDPNTDGEYLMTNAKGNNSRDKSGMRYKPVEVEVELPGGKKQPVCKMEWLGRTDMKAQDVLDTQREKARNGGADRKVEFAKAFLRMKFSDKSQHKCSELYGQAEAEEINDRTLKRARIELEKSGELVIKVDDRRNKGDGYWWIVIQPEKTIPPTDVL